jgi:iron complex outermembrane recepter protein
VPCKKILLLTFLMLAAMFVNAQQLQIRVKDDKGLYLSGATVSVYQLPDSTQPVRKVCDSIVIFDVNLGASYRIEVTATGKDPFQTSIQIGKTTETLTAILRTKAGDLSAVTVVSSRKALFTQEDDKTIIDATVLANSSSNAYEVLEKTPGAIVDQDGNVYLSSTTPATIYINGREMKLSSADLAALLKSLPANSVSKVEILRSPSAKFDAATSGGILNIVLKKGVKLGSSGSANIAWFQGVYATGTAGFNLNRSIGKLNSYFSYQYTARNNFEKLESVRKILRDSSDIVQSSYTTYPTQTHNSTGGVDYSLNEKWTLGYDYRLTVTNNRSIAYNKIDVFKEPTGFPLADNSSDVNNKNRSIYWGNTISAKYKIDSSGSEWSNVFEYNYYRYRNSQDYYNQFYNPPRPYISGDGENDNRKNMWVLQTDLVKKLPKQLTLEAGGKLSISNSRNSAEYFIDTGNNVRRPDPFQTNTFKYRESIGAVYLQVARTFFGFTFKPGLRLETTDIEGRQLVPGDTVFRIKRTDLFPYIYLKHKLFKMFGTSLIGNAIYRRSIRRPYYETLNPYPKFIDPFLFEVGNPSLKPQFTTNYEFNVTFDNFPVVAVGINQTKDIFSSVTYQDDNTKISFRTYDNLGENKEVYLKLIGGIPPGGKYFFYMGMQYNYNEYRGQYQNQPLDYNRGSYTFFTYHEFRPSKLLTLSMQGFLRTKGLQNFYELENFGGLFLSANRSIMKKKGNIILSLNDALRTNQVRFQINQADVVASGKRVNDTRRLGITFRYNFGFKPKEEKKSGFDAPAETKEN